MDSTLPLSLAPGPLRAMTPGGQHRLPRTLVRRRVTWLPVNQAGFRHAHTRDEGVSDALLMTKRAIGHTTTPLSFVYRRQTSLPWKQHNVTTTPFSSSSSSGQVLRIMTIIV